MQPPGVMARTRSHSGCLLLVIVLSGRGLATGQEPSGGLTAGTLFQGSLNELGSVTRLDVTGGYVFNRNWSIEVGVPLYFIRPSASTASPRGA